MRTVAVAATALLASQSEAFHAPAAQMSRSAIKVSMGPGPDPKIFGTSLPTKRTRAGFDKNAEARRLDALVTGTNWPPRTPPVPGKGYLFFQGPTPKTGVQKDLPNFFSAENFENLQINSRQLAVTATGFLSLLLILVGLSTSTMAPPAKGPAPPPAAKSAPAPTVDKEAAAKAKAEKEAAAKAEKEAAAKAKAEAAATAKAEKEAKAKAEKEAAAKAKPAAEKAAAPAPAPAPAPPAPPAPPPPPPPPPPGPPVAEKAKGETDLSADEARAILKNIKKTPLGAPKN